MSDDFHRPTYTSTSSDVHRAFNASQVRLYGVVGPYFNAGKTEPEEDKKGPRVVTGVSHGKGAFTLVYQRQDEGRVDQKSVAKGQGRAENNGNKTDNVVDKVRGALPALRNIVGADFHLADSSCVFVKSVIDRYIILVSSINTSRKEDSANTKVLTSGIIFGYAYEGHCYDLPKPKIMLIPALPETIPDDDCGYDKKMKSANYKVWIVDKLDQCIEFEVSQGFVEQLVLEANLPGKRSPSMYAGRMMLAHRAGRLSE